LPLSAYQLTRAIPRHSRFVITFLQILAEFFMMSGAMVEPVVVTGSGRLPTRHFCENRITQAWSPQMEQPLGKQVAVEPVGKVESQ
jgi:hypothetical protein